MECLLCSPDLEPVLASNAEWLLILNSNQNLLGRCIVVARQHIMSFTNLAPEQGRDLNELMNRGQQVLEFAFNPDRIDFVKNHDQHINMHIVPRFSGPREFAGTTFEDSTWPSETLPGDPRSLDEPIFTEIEGLLTDVWAAQGFPD